MNINDFYSYTPNLKMSKIVKKKLLAGLERCKKVFFLSRNELPEFLLYCFRAAPVLLFDLQNSILHTPHQKALTTLKNMFILKSFSLLSSKRVP